MNFKINIDGGARGNPGPAAAAVIVRDAETEKTLLEAGFYLGAATNNVAEYQALLRALQIAIEMGATEVQICSDSELMVRQITGEYRVKSPDLIPLYQQAQMLLLRIDTWQIRHVYREDNRRADEVVNMALDAQRDIKIGEADLPCSESVAPQQPLEVPTDASPRWTATITGDPQGQCPAACPPGRTYRFGPSTPAGFCIFAAQAVFEEEPAFWRTQEESKATTRCPRCGVRIDMELTSPEDSGSA